MFAQPVSDTIKHGINPDLICGKVHAFERIIRDLQFMVEALEDIPRCTLPLDLCLHADCWAEGQQVLGGERWKKGGERYVCQQFELSNSAACPELAHAPCLFFFSRECLIAHISEHVPAPGPSA